MIKWKKKDGQEVETNEFPASIKAAEDMGWTRKVVAKKKPVKAVSK